MPRVTMLPARLDSLFARLLLAQLVLVLSCVIIFGAFVITERNTLQMPHFAEAWAPAFTAAVALAPSAESAPVLGLPGGIRRQAGPPTGLRLEVTALPGPDLLLRQLGLRGVQVDAFWLVLTDGNLSFWSRVVSADAPGVWISGRVPAVLPHWTARATVTFTLLLIVIGLVSRSLARHITQPLDRLRLRMQAHAQAGAEAVAPPLAVGKRKAPPELIAMDAAYAQLAQRLQRNERERALLLAGVSHDLRSPLARIRLAAEMLPESSDNRDGVTSITRNVDHADRLIASFLEFVHAGASELDPAEVVDLAATARLVVKRFERPARELRLQAPRRLGLQGATALLVERLIVNLIDNAIKHGSLPVLVDIAGDGDAAVITVIDAGPGLPPAGAARLVEAFARGDASRGVPGFGLGLAIAQQIVSRLGGELSFARDDTGHQVRARLPFTRQSPGGPKPPAKPRKAPGSLA
jgi:two-component system osmolarity sensor histidine kinase EnvZ